MNIFNSLDERIAAFRSSKVYPVISSEYCAERSPVFILEQVLEGGAKVVQMREKNMCDRAFAELLEKARELTARFGALMIVDDRVDLALASGADGVHLGQEDLPLSMAKKLAPEMLFGVSTHNQEELRKAQEEGCGYLNIGPVFTTGTKTLSMEPLGLETLNELARLVKVPFSVMGGIKFGHLDALKNAGARHVAAVTAFTAADDPAAEVRKWEQALR